MTIQLGPPDRYKLANQAGWPGLLPSRSRWSLGKEKKGLVGSSPAILLREGEFGVTHACRFFGGHFLAPVFSTMTKGEGEEALMVSSDFRRRGREEECFHACWMAFFHPFGPASLHSDDGRLKTAGVGTRFLFLPYVESGSFFSRAID